MSPFGGMSLGSRRGSGDQRGEVSGLRVNRFGLQGQVGRLRGATVQSIQDVCCGYHPHPRIVAMERVSERLKRPEATVSKASPAPRRADQVGHLDYPLAGEELAGRGPLWHAASIRIYFVTELWKRKVGSTCLSPTNTTGILALCPMSFPSRRG